MQDIAFYILVGFALDKNYEDDRTTRTMMTVTIFAHDHAGQQTVE